jgi:hypothetical protein
MNIDSKTSHLQTKLLSKSIFKNSILLTFSDIDHLIIENMIFYEYFQTYILHFNNMDKIIKYHL